MRTLLALLAFASCAHAQQVQIKACAPHAEMAAALLEQAKEFPVGIGLTIENQLFEIYASKAGTWTAVITDAAEGMSCVKSFGTRWAAGPVPEEERDG